MNLTDDTPRVTAAPQPPEPSRSAAAWETLRRFPLTVALLLTLWGAGALTGSLAHGPSRNLLAEVGAGLGPAAAGRWWFLLTAPFFASGPGAYATATLVLVGVLPVLERRLGSRRTAALLLLVQVFGSTAGIGAVAFLRLSGGRWSDQLAASVAVGPGAAVIGAALAGSAALPVLWRRRVRLLALVGLATMALYSGLLPDVLRLVVGVTGLAVGRILFPPGSRPSAPSRPETRVLLALIVAASAVGPLIAAVAQTRVGPLSVLRFVVEPAPDPANLAEACAGGTARECARAHARLRLSGLGPGIMSVMPVLLLLAAAEGLRRGRRAAWTAAVALNTALGALGLFLVARSTTPSHLHGWLALVLPALQPLAVVGALVAARHAFSAGRATEALRRRAAQILGTGVAVCTVYVLGSLAAGAQYDRPPGLVELVRGLPERFLPPGYLRGVEVPFRPVGAVATALYGWTGVVFWTVVLAVAVRTFGRAAPASSGSDLGRARRVLAHTGGSSLSHMITWPGRSYWFLRGADVPGGPDRDLAVIGFHVVGRTALTVGEPGCEPAHRAAAVHGFVRFCHEQGWTPCLYSVGAEVADIARGLGWSTVQVAEETVLSLPGLAFTGKKWQDVRTALNRATRSGITPVWTRYGECSRSTVAQIRTLSEEWVSDKDLPELGFTLGGLDELADDDVRLMLAVDADGLLHGVTSWLPVRRDGAVVGYTMDFMRRRAGGSAGVVEFLVASTVRRCQDDGLEFLSLSGAPLARLDRGAAPDGLQRLLDGTGRALEPVYGFRSLLAFKAKFQPEYRPWFLAYPDPAGLPAIGNALATAYLPGLTARQRARLGRQLAGAARGRQS
ncbi:MAG: hypothetical protein JWP64_4672 [Pseudonocardia sp.]|nr:hypothetical protein [Pseudonocardia sp.]